MTDPREPFETDSPVEGLTATDLDDARLGERGTADLETGAGGTGAAAGASDPTDHDTAREVPDRPPQPGQRPPRRARSGVRRGRRGG